MTIDQEHIDVSKLPNLTNGFVKIKLHNFEEIKTETLKIMAQENPHPWNTGEANYSGIGLTYNPNYEIKEKTQQVLGKINDKVGRDTYEDTWAFSVPLRAAMKLFQAVNIPLSPIRSRIAIIDGSTNVNQRQAWHVDESPYVCLRINIPIQTNEYFHLQTETEIVTPEEGYMYIWDTSKIHRAYCSKENTLRRINLVLGYNPWFQKKGSRWIPNRFHGQNPLTIIPTEY